MKLTLSKRNAALTLMEVLVVVAVLAGLAVILLVSALKDVRKKEFNWECARNLSYVGVAFRMWAQDHQGHFPGSETASNGGWKEYLANADQGSNCWRIYSMLSNELSTPRILHCPFDERLRAADFVSNGLPLDRSLVYFKDNTTLSFFVSAGGNSIAPNSILAGDRNLGPGSKPDPNYGYSPENGTGNDVAIPLTGPVSWSLKMHSAGNAVGSGNILLGDGSVQQVTTANFNNNWLRKTDPTTTWPAGHAPASPSIRLVFP